MAAKLKILGTGDSSSSRFNNNAMVQTERGNLLIDCGYTIKDALFEQGLSISDIDAVYISHVHADHVFGMERLAIESKYYLEKRIKLFLHPEIYKELWEQTLKGCLGTNSEGLSSLDSYFDVDYIENREFTYGGVIFSCFPVKHTPGKPCFGVKINEKFIYTGDTLPLPELFNENDFEIAFHDCSVMHKNPVHSDYKSLISLYEEPVRKKIYLMSYEDGWESVRKKIEEEFAGFAFQGMTICLD